MVRGISLVMNLIWPLIYTQKQERKQDQNKTKQTPKQNRDQQQNKTNKIRQDKTKTQKQGGTF